MTTGDGDDLAGLIPERADSSIIIDDRKTTCVFSRSYCYWHHSVVCLSVCPSLTLCIVELREGAGVESCALTFQGRHFLFTSSDTFALGCIAQLQHSAKNRTAEISASATPDVAFSTVWFSSYTVHRTQYRIGLPCDRYASR